MQLENSIDVWSAFAETPPPLDFVLPNMLAGTVGAMIGPGGVGKSMLALELSMQISGGPDLLGIGNFPFGSVAYLTAEDPRVSLHHRLHEIGKHLTNEQKASVVEGLHVYPLIGERPVISNSRWFDMVKSKADRHRLLIMDTLRRFHTDNENSSEAMSEVIGRLEAIATDTGCAVLFLHHSAKNASQTETLDQQQASRGSSVLSDNVRWQSYLSPMTDQQAKKFGIQANQRPWYVHFGISKSNYGQAFSGKWYMRTPTGVLIPTHPDNVTNRQQRSKCHEYAG